MNFDLEENILGSILIKPELMREVVITEEYFLNEINAFIFNLLKTQYEDTNTISIVGLLENYKSKFDSKFTRTKVAEKITEIMSDIPLSTNFNYYQQSLFEQYTENKIISSIHEFNANKITKQELFDLIHKYENMSINIKSNNYSANEIFKIITSKKKKINFRFEKLSNVADISEHDFVVVAARTGIGKSGFCLNLLEDLSKTYNCIYFNMEISEQQIYRRLISINTGIEMKYFDDIKTDYQKKHVSNGCVRISTRKIKIFNQAQTVANLRRIIINESKKEHTIVFIDHVGLLVQNSNKSIYENITAITKELRQISLNYNCTIFLVAQLNRSADDESLPKISELKDSGELEQSATTVLLLHDENHMNNISKDRVDITFLIGKNRNGSLGMTKLMYNKLNQRFEEIGG